MTKAIFVFLFQFCATSFASSQRTPGWLRGSRRCWNAAHPKVIRSRRLVGAKITARSISSRREGEFFNYNISPCVWRTQLFYDAHSSLLARLNLNLQSSHAQFIYGTRTAHHALGLWMMESRWKNFSPFKSLALLATAYFKHIKRSLWIDSLWIAFQLIRAVISIRG